MSFSALKRKRYSSGNSHMTVSVGLLCTANQGLICKSDNIYTIYRLYYFIFYFILFNTTRGTWSVSMGSTRQECKNLAVQALLPARSASKKALQLTKSFRSLFFGISSAMAAIRLQEKSYLSWSKSILARMHFIRRYHSLMCFFNIFVWRPYCCLPILA